MAVGYSMQLGRMDALVTALASTADAIEEQLSALDAEVLALRSRWSGEAQRAYDQSHIQWQASLRRMNALLRDASSASANVVQRHLDARAEVAALWR
jgi:WXG100 family type VII secretion target